ncbi:MAG TPA: Re/Si-specific NAD(P)(+) transhydrogenase subunit alpha [Verrucomicrobiae bacterium]|jgi:NAD(P) transhydrogenase subunit alpha|nr:Re/Si-specific NAD(P)(+) transhydrogenase subunit alpha [Verrucomicrobiae bacterium]
MQFAVFKEGISGETRVALVPDSVKSLVKKKHGVLVEAGAGLAASIPDAEFEAAGAGIMPDAAALAVAADCLVRVRPVSATDAMTVPEGKALIGFLAPLRNPETVQILAQRRVTSFSLDAIPRITRAQSMDTLSSMATIAGYSAVLLAATNMPRFLPMLTTAAGTIRPSQGLILGAGVAGLQAIATARRLGAVVEAFDVRPAVKEQVKSLGATFIEVPTTENLEDKGGYARQVSAETLAKQQQLLHQRAKLADFIISTAQVPGKPAPRLITREMVADMKPGSVVVDLAAESGGNCELTQANQVVRHNGVTILGPTNLPATLPLDASRMFSRNLSTFILEITNENGFTMDWKNEIFAETCITLNGEMNQQRKMK